jgi:hypothetical protein
MVFFEVWCPLRRHEIRLASPEIPLGDPRRRRKDLPAKSGSGKVRSGRFALPQGEAG